MPPFSKISVACLIALALSGCALGHSVVSVEPASVTANPAQGQAVRIGKVSDDRQFTAEPPQADMASLQDEDMNNPDIRARAIARKRGGFGKALGDVLLPPGQSVAALLRDATAEGFRRSGYRVLTETEEGYAQAVPVDVSIKEFWCWFSPGFASVKATNRALLRIEAPLPPTRDGVLVRGGGVVSGMAITESDWQKVAGMGVQSLTENTAAVLAGRPQAEPPR